MIPKLVFILLFTYTFTRNFESTTYIRSKGKLATLFCHFVIVLDIDLPSVPNNF